jgi:hypothetical protein
MGICHITDSGIDFLYEYYRVIIRDRTCTVEVSSACISRYSD